MRAFLKYLSIQFKLDIRERGTLLNYYLVPLIFYLIMSSVFSSISPMMKPTLAASMTIFAITLGAIMGSPITIIKMRESGTFRAFKVNGISGLTVMLVQAVSTFLHLLLVALIIYIVSPLAYHSDIPKSPEYYFLILFFFLLASIGVGLFIGVVSRSQSFATMCSMAVFMPTIILSGIMFPANMLPAPAMWLGRIFPSTHALQSFFGFAYQMDTDINAGLSLAIVVGIGLLMFLLAAWQFSNIRKSEQS
jgi:ABC-2 type transport system permease protein